MNCQTLVVVIRAAQERTLDLCQDLVLEQVPKECLHVVNEVPFEAALRRCYEIGIGSGAKWMMTLDADVLLREGAIQDFLAQAETLPEHYFEIEGLLYDKFTDIYRSVGHRIYRTKYLEKALQQIPQHREAIRPEYTTVNRMEQLGYPSMEMGSVFGIHDYEQFLGDVYRKAFVHSIKHPRRVPKFIEQWKQAADQDDDFKVAIRGLYDGLMFTGTTAIDKRDFTEKAAIALRDLGLSERSQVISSKTGFSMVNSILAAAGPVPEGRFPVRPLKQLSRISRLKKRYTHMGVVRCAIYSVGAALSKVGERLKRNAVGIVKP